MTLSYARVFSFQIKCCPSFFIYVDDSLIILVFNDDDDDDDDDDDLLMTVDYWRCTDIAVGKK